MIAHYLITPGRENNMDYMAETLLKYQTIHIEELIGPKGPRQRNMRDLSPAEICNYAAEDADITLRLKNVLEPKLKEVGAVELFHNIEMPLVPILADMEYTGVKLDTKALDEVRLTFNERMLQLEKEIYELAGQVIYYTIVKEVLGEKWLTNKYLRLGTSRLANLLLSEIEGEEIKFF